MKTIAVSMDEALLAGIDRLARARPRSPGRGRPRRPNRSDLIRQAVRDYLLRQQRQDREARERAVLTENRARLERQLEVLVAEQAG